MPWISADIQKDTDNDNIGSIRVVWEVKVAGVTTEFFVYSGRIDRSTAGSRNAFVTAAKAALAAHQAQETTLNSAETTLLNLLNA